MQNYPKTMTPVGQLAAATGKFLLAFAIISTLSISQVKCSSYLDDYFLPTAKIALNKIQQSLSPSSSYTPPNQPLPPNVSQQEQSGSGASQPTTSFIDQQQQAITKTIPELPALANNSTGTTAEATSRPVVGSSNGEQPETGSGAPSTEWPPAVQQSIGESQGSPVVSSQGLPGESSGGIPTPADPHKPSTSIIETSTELATNSDPTLAATTSASEDPIATANQEQVATAVETRTGGLGPKLAEVTAFDETSKVAATTTTTIQPETQTSANQAEPPQPPALVVESKSADEAAIRETELEAVAAVDASIGFGDLFGSMGDSCYDEYANARYCEPEFENLAYERQVEVSSECGNPPSRFCTAYLNERHEQIRNCHICDSQHPKKRHPAAYLTDMNNSNQPTCWVSAPINAATSSMESSSNNNNNNSNSTSVSGGAPSSIIGGDSQLAGTGRPDNVTLALNLDKKYEITYISMQFCSMKPDSLAIYKSMDYGRSWSPYQFYSSQCRRMYGRQSRATGAAGGSGRQARGDELEASCINTNSSSTSQSNQSQSSFSSGRIAFSTLDGRPASHNNNNNNNLDRAKQLQDWITATNIKIVLDRHQASWIHSNLIHPHAHNNHHNHKQQPDAAGAGSPKHGAPSVGAQPQQTVPATPETTTLSTQNSNSNNDPSPIVESSLTSPSDTFNYAMSDLTVGGRCKCNGHASRCIHSKEGRLQCDCRHNTAGRDCEKCAPFHFDRPWARATHLDANPCQPCNCNGHSRKCRFDAELYRLSGKRSGGVCIGCKDNTAGRYCNYCKEEFTRDHSKPMSDKEACKHCDCHPIGSLGRACNQTTGQCPCKEGVSGLQCNRCAPGYQQSSSLTDPCIKLPENENDINYYPPLTVDGDVDRSATSEHQEDGAAATATSTTDQHQSPSLEETVPPPVVGPARFKQQANKLNPQQTSDDQQQDLGGDDGPPMGSQFDATMQMHPQDKDDDTSEGGGGMEDQQPGFGGDVRKPSHRNSHWRDQAARQGSSRNSNKAGTYYRYHYQRHPSNRHPAQPSYDQPPLGTGSLSDEDDNEDQEQDQDDEQMPRRGGGAARPIQQASSSSSSSDDDGYMMPHHQLINSRRGYNYYATNAYGNKQRYNEYRGQRRLHQNGQRHRGLEAELPAIQPMASVEHGSADEMNSLDDATNYGESVGMPPTPLLSNTIYADDNFNQIQTPNLRRLATSRGRQGPGGSGGRQRGSHFNSDQQQLQQPNLVSNEIVCGDCQSGTRRLNLRQFCHLHFAIKATILNKYMADDWTRFEVEIQDIFKSQGGPSSAAAAATAATQSGDLRAAMNNGLLADEPSIVARGGNGSAAAAAAAGLLDAASTIEQNVPITHRIKVGTIQSIWVPTEDLACRCPRLKLRSTYLLMGSIDAKENSANALQLDRHGVAVEWESSLQKRLLRYQRRLSRGKC